MTPANSPFKLPENLAAKARPALIAADEQHFDLIASTLASTVSQLGEQLVAARREHVRLGQAAVERDVEVRRLATRLRTLERFGLDLCLGRIDPADGSGPLYIGRLGLTDSAGNRLLTDWRSPAAEPFFGATHADPMGLAGRRRYRWTRGNITDYWDEAFALDGTAPDSTAALEDLSAFVASLGSARSETMRDVLGTIAADQDAVIRAPARGTLVVDGGPGTGKTVVALHRAAYLIYSDPRIGRHQGGVLFVGPHQPFLNYIADVLPGLGEDGVRTATLRNLVPEGAEALPEREPNVARLKSTAAMVSAIESAVRFYEQPPAGALDLETPWVDLRVSPADWAEAFAAPGPGTPHNEARTEVWEALLDILEDRHNIGDFPEGALRQAIARHGELAATFSQAWPLLQYTDIVGDLWRVPAYLRLCAPWLSRAEVELLQREDPSAWTVADLPLLDAARLRLGDPEESRRRLRQAAVERSGRELMDRVVEDLIAADDSELLVMTMLRGDDMRDKLGGQDQVPGAEPDALAGPFEHIVVDEAQELTDAQWQMLLQRCPSRSFTVVGDRAQARHGFAESWEERLARVGLGSISLARLGVNYRTPAEVMDAAGPVIRAALPDANVPASIRSGPPVLYGSTSELGSRLEAWLGANPAGTACVISVQALEPVVLAMPRVAVLAPELAKGLEFDLVVLVEPESFGTGITGAVDRYVAMTRATAQLVVLG